MEASELKMNTEHNNNKWIKPSHLVYVRWGATDRELEHQNVYVLFEKLPLLTVHTRWPQPCYNHFAQTALNHVRSYTRVTIYSGPVHGKFHGKPRPIQSFYALKLHRAQCMLYINTSPANVFPFYGILQRLSQKRKLRIMQRCGHGSSVGIATDYGLEGPRSNPGGGRDFPPV
jgi:hypothetical protein